MQLKLFELPKNQFEASSGLMPQITAFKQKVGSTKIEFKVFGNSAPQQVKLYFGANSEIPTHPATAKTVSTIADGESIYSIEWDPRLDGICSSDQVSCQLQLD
jgi:hypothetical protein